MYDPNVNPCYDRKTKTDCPNRCAGCSLNCSEWEAYAKERNDEYAKRRRQFQSNLFADYGFWKRYWKEKTKRR